MGSMIGASSAASYMCSGQDAAGAICQPSMVGPDRLHECRDPADPGTWRRRAWNAASAKSRPAARSRCAATGVGFPPDFGILENVGKLQIINRKVWEVVVSHRDQYPCFRGIITSAGFRRPNLPHT
ncbi:hypothetical protein [Plastoroseomonas hellenica]|uniref:hypothetical protein n=1 Tax=Plastoroseomonas hellenica TaxID=2687306 RepID=UPI001BAD77ED|nr:hypothetical protein [Plastoroseomonas hellenica]MBR0644712.1 hypothetical protein [Plastoroseomonas hellenica]